MQTPQGYIATAPLNGLAGGSYVIFHGDGAVTASSENGDVLWNHASFDFTRWTGRYPPNNSGNDVVVFDPSIPMGVDPLDPFRETGEHPFATGDVTADGIDDVAVAHYFPPGVNAISGPVGGTFVTVINGQTGSLVWSRMYPGYVVNLAIVDGVLIVADETGNLRGPAGGQLGQDGTVSILEAWGFTNSGATANLAWTVSTGTQWARWLALEKLPNGKIAAAWTNTAVGSGNATVGNELVVSVATGATDWTIATTGYPRYLRFDSSRNYVVAIEQADPSSTYAYSIVARNLNDGTIANTIPQDSAVALNFQIGDLDGDGSADYVVSDASYLPCTPPLGCVGLQNGGRVQAINPTTGAQFWSQVRGSQLVDPANPLAGSGIPLPYGLVLVPHTVGTDVVVGTFIPDGNMELERLNGALNLSGPGGTVLWSQSASNLFLPFFLSVYEKNGTQFVRTASSRPHIYGAGFSLQLDNVGATLVMDGLTPYQVVRSFNASNGNQVSAVPLLGRLHAAAGTKVNDDTTSDIIVGGESGAVFALDGTKIDSSPVILWRQTVAGPVHQITAVDLDGDGIDEIVVAATHAIDVLESATGDLRYEIPYAADYIWSFLTADLNADGKIDIVVPGASSIKAYSGPNGLVLWSFAPSGSQATGTLFSNVAISPDNLITAQYAFGTQNPLQRTGSGFTRAIVGINGATGAVLWNEVTQNSPNQSSFPQFWHGTVAGRLDGILASVVGFSWVSYDATLDAFTPQMEIRDALTGTVINSLPPPPYYNGSMGTLLIPEKGILSYAGNASWLLTPAQSGQAMGYDIPLDMQIGNFGPLGKRIVEAEYPWSLDVFGQNGIDFAPWTGPIAHAARYYHAISPSRVYLQDLDDDGSDEIIRVQNDSDGNSALVAAIQGFGYEPNPYSDGLDILNLRPVSLHVTSVYRQSDAHIVIQGVGAPNTSYTVETSPDLNPDSFVSIGTANSNAVGAIEFEDVEAANFSTRFYRFVSP